MARAFDLDQFPVLRGRHQFPLMTNDSQTPYAEIGGPEAVKQVVERFYHLLDVSPDYTAVRALHGPDTSHARQTLLEFLTSWLGGPALYFQRPERRCVMSVHAHFPIGAREVRHWVDCMAQAMNDCGIDEGPRLRIHQALDKFAGRMRNQE